MTGGVDEGVVNLSGLSGDIREKKVVNQELM